MAQSPFDDFRVEPLERVDKISHSVEAFKEFVRQASPDGIPTDRGYFESLMRQERKASNAIAQGGAERGADVAVEINRTLERPSFFDEVGKRSQHATDPNRPSSLDLIAQAQISAAKIEGIKNDLRTPELQVKGSVQRLLKTKLTDINDNLKVAFSKAGIEYVPQEERTLRTNPLLSFFDMLSHGQNQLETLASHVHDISNKQTEIKPTDLLAMQLKVGRIQQELEFFSNLLNKSLESTKTLMNVQV